MDTPQYCNYTTQALQRVLHVFGPKPRTRGTHGSIGTAYKRRGARSRVFDLVDSWRLKPPPTTRARQGSVTSPFRQSAPCLP